MYVNINETGNDYDLILIGSAGGNTGTNGFDPTAFHR